MNTWIRVWIALSVTTWLWYNVKILLEGDYDWREPIVSIPFAAVTCGVFIGLVRLWVWAIP